MKRMQHTPTHKHPMIHMHMHVCVRHIYSERISVAPSAYMLIVIKRIEFEITQPEIEGGPRLNELPKI